MKHGFSMVDRASRLAADETGAGLQRGVDVNAVGRSEVTGAHGEVVTSVIFGWAGMQVGWELVRGADAVRRLVSWNCMLEVELAMA